MLRLLPFLISALTGTDTLLVSPAWLSAHLGQPGTVVIHADRDRAAFDAGHIPGSRFLSLSSIVIERDGIPNELPPVAALDSVFETLGIGGESRVVITGDALAAGRLFFTLDYLGHGDRAALLDGGTPAWVAAGFPVESVETITDGAPFTPLPKAGVVVDAAWVQAHLHDSTIALLDARPAADYAGTPGSAPPTGHIPGARNLFWKSTMGGTPPVLLDRATLEGMFFGAGAAPGKLVVTYCKTGVQASFLYFVARYLGYDVRMYDGSFSEWSRIPGALIEQGAGK
jgi:thiosulfate/3-mercaptopyruvate sulfurtransferase